MLAPGLLALLAITAFPLVYNAYNSVHHVNLLDGPNHPFNGLANYRLLLNDNSFLPALERTLGFIVVSVGLEVVAGMGLALLLNRKFAGRGLLRAALLIPWAVPTVVSATLWRSMFDPRNGFVNMLLGLFHMPGAHTTWLANTWSAWVTILVADAWQSTPLVCILLLAGLQSVPGEVYEAARVDGASSWRTFRSITWPLLRPAVLVTVVFRTLSALMVFDVVYVLTSGQPGSSTETLSFIDYRAFLVADDFGYGGAIAMSMVITALLLASVLRRVLASRF